MNLQADRTWRSALAVVVALRLLAPLVALAASDHKLPGIPRYDYRPLYGDANGYYAALREFQAAAANVSPLLLALTAILAVGVSWAALLNRRRRWVPSWISFLAITFVLALGTTLAIVEMQDTGAAVVGWSIVWAGAALPFRALGIAPTPSVAFGIGLALSLAANMVTTVATAYLGLYATGRRSVGIAAAALLSVWPLVVGPLTDGRAWENGMWMVDTGLALYTEPLSTALVTCGVLIALRAPMRPIAVALSGSLLGFATVVKLSNVAVAALVVAALVARVGARRSLPFVLAGAVWLAPLLAYWPKGYVGIYDGQTSASEHPWGLSYVIDAWSDSSMFTPVVLVLVVPLAVVGFVSLAGWYARALVGGPVAVTALVYSFYDVTRLHPRFLYVALPCVFVLDAAAIAWLGDRSGSVVRSRRRGDDVAGGSGELAP